MLYSPDASLGMLFVAMPQAKESLPLAVAAVAVPPLSVVKPPHVVAPGSAAIAGLEVSAKVSTV
jgi:hypothetical protein